MIFVDAHVHIHDCFNPAEFFDRAFSNLKGAAATLGMASEFTGVLIFAESADDHYYSKLGQLADAQNPPRTPIDLGAWNVNRTDEACSLVITDGNKRLIVIAGHQVSAAEGLEVLMLGTAQKVKDGLPIFELLQKASSLNALRVIPWGAGKWLFSRGKLLRDIIDSIETDDFFLGDEGGRPVFWRIPRHFLFAAAKGIRNLPGTDPLPFPWEVRRICTFGFWFLASIDWSKPWAIMKAALCDPNLTLHPFGKLQGPFLFFRNQFGMQMRKREKHRLLNPKSYNANTF